MFPVLINLKENDSDTSIRIVDPSSALDYREKSVPAIFQAQRRTDQTLEGPLRFYFIERSKLQ